MQELGITHLFNLIFGPVFGWLMQLVGFHPAQPHAPINDTFALEMLVAFGLIAFFLVVRTRFQSKIRTRRSRSPR